MPDFTIRTIIEALKKPERQCQHTHIEDLSAIGFELDEEHLQVVTGGGNSTSTNGNIPGHWAGYGSNSTWIGSQSFSDSD